MLNKDKSNQNEKTRNRAQYLLKEKNFQPEEIGILLVNAAASLNTDIRHQMIINQEGDHASA